MQPDYDGVKYYGENDMSLGPYLEKSLSVLDSFDAERCYSDVNAVIELFNVYRILSSNRIRKDIIDKYRPIAKESISIIARFFKRICDKTFLDIYDSVSFRYIDDFWTLFDKFKLYERISETIFNEVIMSSETVLDLILVHKATVHHYDRNLADALRKSDQTARIIIREFLEKKQGTHKKYYFPKTLLVSEFEVILDKYIDSVDANIGVLQLLAISQSSAECPISDKLRLKARKKADDYWKSNVASFVRIDGAIGVCFKNADEVVKVEINENNKWQYIYDVKWIKQNLDYSTLLNNFIYMFNYTDLSFRCAFPLIESKLGIFEKDLGIKGKKEYYNSIAFQQTNIKSHAEMRGYLRILSESGVYIEDIFRWFFEEYLKTEFSVSSFVINLPSSDATWLEKCKLLPSEMEGVLKQFALYSENGCIDRELYEMSSNAVRFENIPSMQRKKYIYGVGEAILEEQFLLFSDQSMLNYLHKENKSYGSFAEVLLTREVTASDYGEWMQASIQWLRERGVIYIDDLSGTISANWPRVMLLRDLYDKEVLCLSYLIDKTEVDKLVAAGDLEYGSSLFSIPEQKYLNYILNKAEYSNGLDLRNKYSHSTYPLDERQQEYDYIIMLRTMAFIIIKINEEFCLKYPES